jgi:hypothetical protein
LGFRGGFDFFVYERALVIVKVGASETYNAIAVAEEIRSDHGSAHQARLEAKAARPIQELLGANPRNRLIPNSMITSVRLGKGLVASRLKVKLSDGGTVRCVWVSLSSRFLPNPRVDEVQAALMRAGVPLEAAGLSE